MTDANPNALTWVFSYKVADHTDPAPEFDLIKTLADMPFHQYLAFHLTQHTKQKDYYIRGLVRCLKSRSLLQLRDYLPLATFKPVRGMFSSVVVADKLHPRGRVGLLQEYGSINLKRSRACTGSCPCCCASNKRVAVDTPPTN